MRRVLPFAGAAVAGALLLALFSALLGGEAKPAAAKPAATTWTAPGGAYSIATPKGWKVEATGKAATVLKRSDERGVVVIRRAGAIAEPLDRFGRRLERTLAERFADYRPAGTRVTTVGGREGLISTFARPQANQVQSIVVAPAGEHSYTLDLVADGDAPDVARELAGMVRSFAPKR